MFKDDLFRPLVKISTQGGFIPDDLILHNIHLEKLPVAGGGYSHVYRGAFRGRIVAVKVMRVNETSDFVRILKVCCISSPPN